MNKLWNRVRQAELSVPKSRCTNKGIRERLDEGPRPRCSVRTERAALAAREPVLGRRVLIHFQKPARHSGAREPNPHQRPS
jgi:hypothetical protein